jgi:farnesyl-diphosphate farnesyltransferase
MFRDLLISTMRPRELNALIKVKFGADFKATQEKRDLDKDADSMGDMEYCYAALNKVSRSFSVVIAQLPQELRDPVCIFYLVLRALDTIEDDMAFPIEKKLPLLKTFYKKNADPSWKMEGVGDSANYRALLAHYGKVSRSYLQLDEAYQNVISDICKKMGEGMAEFASRPVVSLDDWDEYCHYVAGLVGIGLSGLFSASGLEASYLKDEQYLANSMGLFLQKTNIIRDYFEDIHSDRIFWPEDVWKKYSNDLEWFAEHPYSHRSLSCLNHLVSDALRHVPDVIKYLGMIRDPQVFRFCAIPQVMAMATLARVYNNPKVFKGVVKIRKGLAARLIFYTENMDQVLEEFEFFAREIQEELNMADPNHPIVKQRLEQIIQAGTEKRNGSHVQVGLSTKLYRLVS